MRLPPRKDWNTPSWGGSWPDLDLELDCSRGLASPLGFCTSPSLKNRSVIPLHCKGSLNSGSTKPRPCCERHKQLPWLQQEISAALGPARHPALRGPMNAVQMRTPPKGSEPQHANSLGKDQHGTRFAEVPFPGGTELEVHTGTEHRDGVALL